VPQRSIKEPVQGFCAHGVLRLAERSAQQGGEGCDLLAINQVRDDPSAQLALRAESKAKPVATYQPGCQRSLSGVSSYLLSPVRGLSIAGGRLIWTATLYRR